jgi:protease-4
MFSVTSDFSPLARARLQAFLDATYQGFKDRVAAGRHMSADAVETVAQGRVWSGEEAKAKGLVDALGGYEVALRLAKEAAHIPPGAPVQLTVFPREEGLAEFLYDRVTGREREDNDIGVTVIGRAVEVAQPLLQHIEALLDNTDILMMPPVLQPQ